MTKTKKKLSCSKIAPKQVHECIKRFKLFCSELDNKNKCKKCKRKKVCMMFKIRLGQVSCICDEIIKLSKYKLELACKEDPHHIYIDKILSKTNYSKQIIKGCLDCNGCKNDILCQNCNKTLIDLFESNESFISILEQDLL